MKYTLIAITLLLASCANSTKTTNNTHSSQDTIKQSLIDTDGDGIPDQQEIYVYKTDPKSKDTDNDGLTDGEEILKYGTDPLMPDTDGDGLTDGYEVNVLKTNPKKMDTDGDGVNDKYDKCPTVSGKLPDGCPRVFWELSYICCSDDTSILLS